MRTPLSPAKYKPLLIRAHAWADIEQHYQKLIACSWQLEPLLKLVRHINANKYSERLFAITSHDELSVSIYNPMEFDREALRLSFERESQQWLFRYFPKPYEPVAFEQTYPAEEGLEKFESFIRMMKW